MEIRAFIWEDRPWLNHTELGECTMHENSLQLPAKFQMSCGESYTKAFSYNCSYGQQVLQ